MRALVRQQCALQNGLFTRNKRRLLQYTDDLFINFVDVTPATVCTCGKNTVLIEQIEGTDSVFQTNVEIIKAKIGCREPPYRRRW